MCAYFRLDKKNSEASVTLYASSMIDSRATETLTGTGIV